MPTGCASVRSLRIGAQNDKSRKIGKVQQALFGSIVEGRAGSRYGLVVENVEVKLEAGDYHQSPD